MKKNIITRNFKGGSYSTILTVIVIAVLIVANVIINALPATVTKYDFSEEKLYTLSEQTKKVAAGLQDDVTIYLVAQSGKEDASIVELLDKYKALSSHIKVVKKDPAVNPNFTADYTQDTVVDNSLVVESKKRAKVVPFSEIYVTAYTTNVTSTGEYEETQTFSGEDAVTSALDYVTTDNLPKMYVVKGHGESDMDSSLKQEIARENIELLELQLAATKQIPEDADCLYMQAPTSDINEDEAKMLQEYLQKGGNLFYTSFYQKGQTPHLDAFLEDYGIKVDEGIVCEGNSNYVFQNQRAYILPMYGQHDIVRPLSDERKTVIVPFGQNIQILSDKRSSLRATTLLKSTSTGYIKTLDSETLEKEKDDQTGAMALAVAVTDEIDEKTNAKIVVVSTPYIGNNQLNAYVSGGNFDFLLNTVGFLCEHESMISIRTKTIYSALLTVSSGQFTAWTFLLMLFIPIVIIVSGLIVWLKRRKR